MISHFGRLLAVAALALAGAAASAQESDNRVATMTDWNVFVEENPKQCWGVSRPKETVNSRDGQPVSVRRGDILFFVNFQPGKPPEISFTGGYPFAKGSTVELVIDGQSYLLVTDSETDPEWAWPGTPEDDAKVLAAMKAGTSAVLTGRSGKGTQTVDTFSLRGFTLAMEDAEKRCQ
jgi:hypothetical protein